MKASEKLLKMEELANELITELDDVLGGFFTKFRTKIENWQMSDRTGYVVLYKPVISDDEAYEIGTNLLPEIQDKIEDLGLRAAFEYTQKDKELRLVLYPRPS